VSRWPLIGWLARQNGTIFVSRERRHSVGDQLASVREALSRHQPVAIFPEGTTGSGETLLPFKSALLAVLADAPAELQVQPVLMDYGAATSDILWPDGESAGANVRRILSRPGPLVMTLHFLDPFGANQFAGRKAITAEARKRIEAAQSPSAYPPGSV
jgi:1-acyl-sn-glycerol-3-phosphate acyltransferase